MDINENEKVIGSEATAEETVEEIVENEEISAQDNTSTIEIAQEDIDEELMRYGAYNDTEEAEQEEDVEEKKKSKIQLPIIISAVAILITAVAVFGTLFVYNTFFKPGINGVWELQDSVGSGTYFVFDKDGNISMNGGGIEYFGTYSMDKNENGEDVLRTDFYILAYYGGEAVVTYSADKKVMTMNFGDAMGAVNFVKSELPEHKIDPTVIDHASADELKIDALNIDEAIIGTWSEDMYGTYTFNEDGTGSYLSEYSYNEYYGYGLGMRYNYKYTVYEDQILITLEYYTGAVDSGSFTYALDKDTLILNGMGYKKVVE